jgi:hypothetical protein
MPHLVCLESPEVDGVVINANVEQEGTFRRLVAIHCSHITLLSLENPYINLVETRQSAHFDVSASMVGLLEEAAVRIDT